MTTLEQELQLPQDNLAERSVLGAALLSAQAREDILRDGLDAADFYEYRHHTIWEEITRLHGAGRPVDAVTVSAALQASGDLNRIGGAAYLALLVSEVPSAASGRYYARLVRESAVLRRLVAAGMKIVQLGRATDGGEPDAVVAAAAAEIEAVAKSTQTKQDKASTATEILLDLVESLDQPLADVEHGPRWGWLDVDAVMNPLTPGKLVVIGARPGVGKSLAVGCMAASCAFDQGTPALIHTLEMTRVEVMQRLLARTAMVELGSIIRHELTDRDLSRVMRAQGDILDSPLVVDESRGVTPLGLRASIRRHKPAVVFVDYLQLMRGARPENRREEVSALARDLKELAGDEGVCVVAASQLNRNAADRPPVLSDLRESGEIEQSADEVVLLHDDPANPGERALIVAKNRQGASGAHIQLVNQAHFGRLSDMAH